MPKKTLAEKSEPAPCRDTVKEWNKLGEVGFIAGEIIPAR